MPNVSRPFGFAARGGELVHLVYLVYLVFLVCLVEQTRERYDGLKHESA